MLFVEEGADLDRQLAVRVELAPGVHPGKALAAQARQGCIVWVGRWLGGWQPLCPRSKQLLVQCVHAAVHSLLMKWCMCLPACLPA